LSFLRLNSPCAILGEKIDAADAKVCTYSL
jgi:hypothetical protein